MMTRATAGAVAGTAATLPMTILMKSIHRQLPRRQRSAPIPPEQITMRAAEAADMQHMSGAGRQAAIMLSHFGYGAAAGATYSKLEGSLPGNGITRGIIFGLGVWAVSYLGWLPAAGVLPSASRWPAGRNFMMIASHVVWGAFTGITMERLNRGSRTH